jgi:tRNA(fMet)-specific endonuclease VapC
MRVALDTNRYVDFCRGEPVAIDVIQQAHHIFVPFVVLGELRTGFLGGNRNRQNERILTRFLNSNRVEILHADDQTTHHYARVFQELRENGTPIPTNDLWIAALVIQHDLSLFARDRHFDHLPQLVRI